MPSIASLPNELVAFVLDNLRSERDIASLCRTNRKLYEAVSPVLYKNAVDRHDMWPLAFAAFSGTASTMKKILAAGADPNWCFDPMNLPQEAWSLFCLDSDRVRPPRNTPFGTSQTSQPGMGFPPGLLHTTYDPWSASNSEDGFQEDGFPTGGDPNFPNLDLWGTWTGLPLDPDGAPTDSELDDLDDDTSEDSSLPLPDDSDADSSTLGYSDRQRDGAMRDSPVSRFFTSLHIAAGRGNNEVVEVLLDHGALINSSSRLLCGCKRAAGMLNTVESPETEPRLPVWTPLHIAICHNHQDTAMLLLSRGANCVMESLYDQGLVERYDSTALHYAAALGQEDLVKFLVEKGHQTDINVQDRRTLTPLYYAYANGRWDSTVPLLLQMGANINVEIRFYQPYCTITPLGEAVRLGNFDDAQRLIDLGADPFHGFVATGAGHRKGLSPLHLSCMPSARRSGGLKFLDEAEKALQRMKIVETFIAKGSDIHGTDCSGDTPLISAAQNRVVPSLKALIAAGADVNARNSLGRTVVMQAVLGPPSPPTSSPDTDFDSDTIGVVSEVLTELHRGGARFQDVDPNGNNVLHLLFTGKSDSTFVNDVIPFILSFPGADALVSARNKEGQLAFELAFCDGSIKACQTLLRRGLVQRVLTSADLQRMFKFCANKTHPDSRYLDLLLDLDFDRVLLSNATLFTESVTNGAWCLASAMARRGIPPLDRTTCTRLLRRALSSAAWGIAYQLIERGADVNAIDEDGTETPLLLVVNQAGLWDNYRVEKLTQILIDRGANIHHSPHGTSLDRPLTRAIEERVPSLVRLMLRDRPLRNDPRAVGGHYLHHALSFVSTSLAHGKGRDPHPRIAYILIHSGADLTELDQNGDYPLAVLLRGLCAIATELRNYDLDTLLPYTRLLKDLYVPGVRITERNHHGRSIVDYFEELLKTKAGWQQVGRRVKLVDDATGAKVLKFLSDTKLRMMTEGHSVVTTIWDIRLAANSGSSI